MHMSFDVSFLLTGKNNAMEMVVPLRPIPLINLGLYSVALQFCASGWTFRFGQIVYRRAHQSEELWRDETGIGWRLLTEVGLERCPPP